MGRSRKNISIIDISRINLLHSVRASRHPDTQQVPKVDFCALEMKLGGLRHFPATSQSDVRSVKMQMRR